MPSKDANRQKHSPTPGSGRTESAPQKPSDGLEVSDALLAAALSQQNEGVLVLDTRFSSQGYQIVFANRRLGEMTGFDCGELAGQSHGVLHPDPEELNRMRDWVESGSADPYQGEGDILGKDGHAISAAWSYSRMSGNSGSSDHLVAVYRDMTEKHRLQEMLMLSQKLDAIGRMAGGVAHDFNNLVSVINGYSQLLATRFADRPEDLRAIDEIHKAGLKAAGLTRQLLALGRRQKLSISLMDLNQFLRDNKETLTNLVADAGRFELVLSDEPLVVKADADQFQQVLLNLVLNAKDALRDKGKVTVSTSVRTIERRRHHDDDLTPGRYAVLSVKDNGMGMDSETLAHIFEPFFTTKPADKGSGMGLALVYGIVQQCGGHIKVSSTLLLGSTFDILLPLTPSEGGAQRPAGRLPSQELVRGHETILLLEPDIIVAKMLSGMLASEGYHVIEASNSQEAEMVLRKDKTSVHLLITSMGDDEECLRMMPMLATENSRLKVICTAICNSECHVKKSCGDCHRFMLKPFAISEMLRSVRRLLDGA